MNSQDPDSFRDLQGAEQGFQSGISAKQIVRDLVEYSRKITQFLSQEIKSESRSIVTGELNRTSSKLDILAEGLREAAGKLRGSHSFSLANIMEIGSESMMRLSNNLRETSPEAIRDDVEDLARNHPGIFLGSTVIAGILLGQLFSSPGERKGTVQQIHPGSVSSIEYKPEGDEGEHYVQH